jgi:hypothetical protein
MDKFINKEIEFTNFYLNRISQSFNKEKDYYSTKYDVRDNFKLSDQEFRRKCMQIDKKLIGMADVEFKNIFEVPKNVSRNDLATFLKGAK